jgi:hypothetical protein
LCFVELPNLFPAAEEQQPAQPAQRQRDKEEVEFRFHGVVFFAEIC